MAIKMYRAQTFISIAIFIISFGLWSFCKADTLYDFSMNTQPFANLVASSDPSAPFSLYFFLNSSGGPSNTVTLSNFNFGPGGSALIPTTLTYGLASGDAAPGDQIILGDDPVNNTLDGLIEQFDPGSTLSFQVDASNNLSDLFPDQFGFAILDSSLSNIATTDLAADTFATLTFTSTMAIETYDINPDLGIGSVSPISLAAAAPLSSALKMAISLLPLMALMAQRYRRRSFSV